jgi:hypothetical protein
LPRLYSVRKRLGIFTIGGGVPRNWSQQFGPFIELRHRRGGEDLPLKRYHYGLRICPEPVFWGGLSGSPYSEAVSWGKFVPPAEGGKFGEVFVCGLPRVGASARKKGADRGRRAGAFTEEEFFVSCGAIPCSSRFTMTSFRRGFPKATHCLA